MKKLVCVGIKIVKKTNQRTELRVIEGEARDALQSLRDDIQARLNDLRTRVELGIL